MSAEPAGAPPGFLEPVFGQRLLARLVDGIVVAGPVLLLTWAVGGRGGRALAVAAVSLYEVVAVSVAGRTVGKALFGTRVVDARTGAAPIPLQAVLRWMVLAGGAFVALLVPALEGLEVVWFWIAVLPVMSGPLHRGLHDRAARTIVTADAIDEEIAI
ncbi:RDD family protein [Actinomarinicola tropica]|uniref:RDD family protein n=1 Tax=Actinomarinicola tropica TaxID=2789776 RepID=UPI00189B1AF0|nr:RDD family protein [Actinomarinicola tropica]